MDSLPDNAAHILVVDDDQRIRDSLARYLFKNGFRVTTAADATTARATMSGLTFDVLILDVMMPGENGLELARDLKGTSNIPICMLTARAEPEERIQGLEIGVEDYVAKPFEPRELLLRLQNILKRRQGPSGPRDEISMGDYTFQVARGEFSAARSPSSSPSASGSCCASSRSGRERRSRATSWRRTSPPAPSAPSTCRSIACAARSKAIRPIRSICRR